MKDYRYTYKGFSISFSIKFWVFGIGVTPYQLYAGVGPIEIEYSWIR